MLTKPEIADEFIISRLQDEYGLHVSTLTFLPLGADMGTAVYRVVADDGTAYFLKLRKGFDEISVTIPLFLKSQGIKEIIAPFETKSHHGWTDFGEYKMILYPFIEGKNGFEMELSDSHKRTLGAALKAIHSVKLPPELKKQIPQETYSPEWREKVKSFQMLVENTSFDDPIAIQLAEFMKSKKNEINRIVTFAEKLAKILEAKHWDLNLCHSDIHGGNIFINKTGKLYIVDWDNPIFAPPERDLMFIGGGIDNIWNSSHSIYIFYEGYGKHEWGREATEAMAYFRFERIVQDFAAYCEQLLLTNGDRSDRERGYEYFVSNFSPRGTISMALKTYLFLI